MELMADSHTTFHIAMPTDEGFIGRQCQNTDCGRYFKVYEGSLHDRMYCPYCGEHFDKSDLLTDDQREYIMHAGAKQAMLMAARQMQEMMKGTFSDKRFFKVETPPLPESSVHPNYSEETVDSELICPECQTRFQVYGIFGYCPGCREENLLIYDANLAIIEKEIQTSANPQRSLRQAYSELVSTFEYFCREKAKTLGSGHANFQSVQDTREYFKKALQVDIFAILTPIQYETLRRLFLKRHDCQHNLGKVSDNFVKHFPKYRKQLGQPVDLSLDEFRETANLIRQVLDVLVQRVQSVK